MSFSWKALKNRVTRPWVWAWFLGSIFLLAAVLAGIHAVFFTSSEASIERFEEAASGDHGPTVTYIDERENGRVVVYIDHEEDGLIDAVLIRKDKDPNTQVLMAYEITPYEETAESENQRNLTNGWFEARISYPETSAEFVDLNYRYRKVREDYSAKHPEAKSFKENQKFKPPINQAKVDRFLKLLLVTNQEDAKANAARTRRASEIGQLRAYKAFLLMRDDYEDLNRFERRTALALAKAGSVPTGFKLDGGPPLKSIAGIPMVNGCNLRKEFEAYLGDAYYEIDYMSSWSISGQTKKFEDAFMAELRRKGLLDPIPENTSIKN